MVNILFVDDDQSILNSMERLLFDVEEDWDFQFAASGKEALELFYETPFDVVVSDMRMPEMNGAELLREIKDKYPKTIRFILSGYSDMKLILETVQTAEQFLAKPIEPDVLISTIKGAIMSNSIIANEELIEKVSRFEVLPAVPKIYSRLCGIMESPDVTIDEISEVIETDVIVTAKILKLVNSAFFGLRRTIEKVSDAITYLGFDVVKALVLSTELFNGEEFEARNKRIIEKINLESFERAKVASEFVVLTGGNDKKKKETYLIGLLCDVGKIVFVENEYDKYEDVMAKSKKEGITCCEAEKDIFGISHCELSAYLLSKWGFSSAVISNILLHHEMDNIEKEELSSAGNILISNMLLQEKKGNWYMEDTVDNIIKRKVNPKYHKAIRDLKESI